MQVYPVFEKYQRLLARLGRYDNMGMGPRMALHQCIFDIGSTSIVGVGSMHVLLNLHAL